MTIAALPETVSEADLARVLGIAPRTLRDAAKAGHVVRTGRGGYDLAASIAGFVRHLRNTVETRSSGTERLRSTKNSIAELDLAIRRRELIAVDEVDEILMRVVGRVHAEMSGLPRRCSREPGMIRKIDGEVVAALNRIADEADSARDVLVDK